MSDFPIYEIFNPITIGKVNFMGAYMQYYPGAFYNDVDFGPCWIYQCRAIIEGEKFYIVEFVSLKEWNPESGFFSKNFEKKLWDDTLVAFALRETKRKTRRFSCFLE